MTGMTDEERVPHFPVKLWDVVDDESNNIFRWSDDGEAFFVDDVSYESEIMERYPGFVQISSFANLRRLLREYSFTWKNNETGEFEFSHPGFSRGKREKLHLIKTKRKSANTANSGPPKMRRRSAAPDSKLSNSKSAKTWLQPIATGTVRLRMETLMRFPEKFWAVVNDPNDMLYWGEEGTSVIVDDKKFEEEIMQRYPGFVQINSFANLRRLLREYGFSWSIRDNGFFEFSHANMRRDRPDLISGVKTKRKALKAGTPHPYLPFYRIESSVPPHEAKNYTGGYNSCEQQNSGESTSPEVSQAIGAISTQQTNANNDTLYNDDPGSSNAAEHQREPQFQHGTGDHATHHPFFNPAVHINAYRYMSYNPVITGGATAHSSNNQNYWPVQGGGDKVESPFYCWHDHSARCETPSDKQAVSSTQSPNTLRDHSEREGFASTSPSGEAVFLAGKNSKEFEEDQGNEATTESPRVVPPVHMHAPAFSQVCMMNPQQQHYPIAHPLYEPSMYQSIYHPTGLPYQSMTCGSQYKVNASLEDTDFDSVSMTSPQPIHASSTSSPLNVVDENVKIEGNNNDKPMHPVQVSANCQQENHLLDSEGSASSGFFPKSMKVMNML